MREEEIASCKSHIASVSFTNWCIMIFLKKKEFKKKGLLSLLIDNAESDHETESSHRLLSFSMNDKLDNSDVNI